METTKIIAKKMLEEINYDLENTFDNLKDAGLKSLKTVCKYGLVYPIAGNLSYKTRSFLEKKLGKENFDQETSGVESMLVNAALYAMVGLNLDLPSIGTGVLATIASLETMGRIVLSPPYKPLGSLIGGLVSIPIEKRIDNYNKKLNHGEQKNDSQ